MHSDTTHGARASAKPRGRSNLKDEVANHIRTQIYSGAMRPAARIDQDAIAESLGVSRLPVREALHLLEAEGLVQTIPRRGAYVAMITRTDIEDHYEIYALVTATAAQRAAEMMTSREITELEKLVERIEGSSDPATNERLCHLFHRNINFASQSRRLIAVLRLLDASTPIQPPEFTEDWHGRTSEDHRRILDALQRRDGQAARTAMYEHLRNSGDWAIEKLNERGFWADDEETETA